MRPAVNYYRKEGSGLFRGQTDARQRGRASQYGIAPGLAFALAQTLSHRHGTEQKRERYQLRGNTREEKGRGR
jgi:hypothetical protein